MMALFFAVAGVILVGLTYFSKHRFHKTMEAQRADEATLQKKLSDFRAKELDAWKNQKPDDSGSNYSPVDFSDRIYASYPGTAIGEPAAVVEMGPAGMVVLRVSDFKLRIEDDPGDAFRYRLRPIVGPLASVPPEKKKSDPASGAWWMRTKSQD